MECLEDSQIINQIPQLSPKIMDLKYDRQHNSNEDYSKISLSMYISSIIHDIRTPLNCISFMLNQIINSSKQEDIFYSVDISLSNVSLLENYVNDLLDIQQLQNNKFRINLEQFKLQKMLDQVIGPIQIQAEIKNLEFKINNELGEGMEIYSDSRRLKQILFNLLSNSLKFTQQGYIELNLKKIADNLIEFSVYDTGIGIDSELLPKLSKPFQTQNSQGMNKFGIGLGLFICNSLIKQLNSTGQLQISSEKGKWSKFSFELQTGINIQLVQQKSKKSKQINYFEKKFFTKNIETNQSFYSLDAFSRAPQKSMIITNKQAVENNLLISQFKITQTQELVLEEEQDTNQKNKVLIADDNVFNLMILKSYFEKFNASREINCFDLLTASNGSQALDLFIQHNKSQINQNIQLIILDCQMPIMDGYEACNQIKQLINKQQFIPAYIIAYTAFISEDEQERSNQVGFDQIIEKPCSLEQFFKILDQFVTLKE